MTEKEWLECTDPTPMLEFVRAKASERKLRLFASSLCGGVDVADRHADGKATDEELEAASLDAIRGLGVSARYWWETAKTDACRRNIAEAVVEVVRLVMEGDRQWYDEGERLSYENGRLSSDHDNKKKEAKYAVGLLHCIFGNPLCPVSIDPAWLTWNDHTAVRIARAVYDNRHLPSGEVVPARLAVWASDPGSIGWWGQPSGVLNPAYLAVLADALEDGGCANTDILHHCRREGLHVRGCWVVDLVLGKE